MGHKHKKVEEVDEDPHWPFEISIKLDRRRPKIAFMSGCPREYYPEDPGFSKFSLVFGPADPEGAKCNYVPSDNRLDKPISTLGYGIGGLSAPRFPHNVFEDLPAPNVYQSQLVPPPAQRNAKIKRTTWREFVEMYEKIAEDQYNKEEVLQREIEAAVKADKVANRVRGSTAGPISNIKPMNPLTDEERKQKPCQTGSAFGMNLTRNRFERSQNNEIAGVGTYEIGKVDVNRNQSFQITTPEGILIPRVRLVCMPNGCDSCMNCGVKLFESDYYQTKEKRKIRNRDPITDSKYVMTHLSLCSECYCEALTKGLDPWRSHQIPFTFVKARHCNSVHDHKDGLNEFLTRATCKGRRDLARKEIIFSKFFKDNPCHKKIG